LGKYIHPSSNQQKKDNPDNPVQEMLQFVKCLTKQEQKQQQQRMMQTNNADETTITTATTANPCGNFSSILASMEENVIDNNAANSATTTTIQPKAYFISEEHLAFSRSLIHYPRVLQRLQQAVRTPQPQQQQLQLHVVITYRRPLHWLPNARKQVNLRSQKYNRWKGEIPPLFPTALQNLEQDGGQHQHYPTPWELRRIVEQYDIPYSIYDVHHDDDNSNNDTQQQQTSMLETWMCDILLAHNLCQQLRQQRKSISNNNNNNNISSSSSTFSLPPQHSQQPPQEQETKLNALPQRNTDLLYDEIVSAARARGLLLLGTHIQRKQAIRAAQAFWERQPLQPQPLQPQPQQPHLHNNHNNRTTTTMTTDDLPMKCPSPNEMERFWNVSWQLELEMVPSLSLSLSLSSSREEYQKSLLLQQHQYQKKLCSVDIAAVLQDARWQSFFAAMQ
jgi:hypothetical protein